MTQKYSVIISGEVVIDAEDADQAENMIRDQIEVLCWQKSGHPVRQDVLECLQVSGSDILAEDEIAVDLCPRCRKNEKGERPAISRKDNKTEICTQCGTDEALGDFAK